MTLQDILKNELLLHVRRLTVKDYPDDMLSKIVDDYVYKIDWDNKYLAHKGLATVAMWIIKKHKLK